MTINGTDITEFDAKLKQWRVDQGDIDMDNDSEWIRGTPLPVLFGSQVGFKDFTVTLMVYGSSRVDIQEKIGRILAALLEPAELVLDRYPHTFVGIMQKHKITEHNDHSRDRFQTLELQFVGYVCDALTATTFSGISTFEVTNPGNIISPLILELTPTLGIAKTTITGICRDCESGEDLPVTIENLTTGKTIILDGTTGLITEDGALKATDVDIWALPTILPGVNKISVGTTYLNVTAKVLPLFLY